MIESTVSVGDSRTLLSLFGTRDQHLRKIAAALPVAISARDGEIHVEGDQPAVSQATELLEQLRTIVTRNGAVSPDEVTRLLNQVTGEVEKFDDPPIDVLAAGREIRPRTAGQARYVESMRKNDLVICIGPAGSGKTYLAVALAVEYLKRERLRKIVLVRPAVEAGESLGYLPGDIHAKINPYLRPLLDALSEMLGFDQVRKYIDDDLIEVVPLAYMRGRTLNDAFIILDEGQNTTVSQMKMFLTRMGMGSKIVVAGDSTQVDLQHGTRSGLIDAVERLRGIKGVSHVELSGADIVRHRLVQDIVNAYETAASRHESSKKNTTPKRGRGR
ncbi:MAG: PhoH family protein [Pirellulales bacterium]|nr:PhoH family protein [Pirellulales bacterium]